ncbi:MAG: hypothetical protein FD151_1390 [bacterium]|nr:MAG: hypothetical protein FD151_1390 [bacterium]
MISSAAMHMSNIGHAVPSYSSGIYIAIYLWGGCPIFFISSQGISSFSSISAAMGATSLLPNSPACRLISSCSVVRSKQIDIVFLLSVTSSTLSPPGIDGLQQGFNSRSYLIFRNHSRVDHIPINDNPGYAVFFFYICYWMRRKAFRRWNRSVSGPQCAPALPTDHHDRTRY